MLAWGCLIEIPGSTGPRVSNASRIHLPGKRVARRIQPSREQHTAVLRRDRGWIRRTGNQRLLRGMDLKGERKGKQKSRRGPEPAVEKDAPHGYRAFGRKRRQS